MPFPCQITAARCLISTQLRFAEFSTCGASYVPFPGLCARFWLMYLVIDVEFACCSESTTRSVFKRILIRCSTSVPLLSAIYIQLYGELSLYLYGSSLFFVVPQLRQWSLDRTQLIRIDQRNTSNTIPSPITNSKGLLEGRYQGYSVFLKQPGGHRTA